MAAQWHVVSQSLTTQISDSGPGFESVWEVRYMIDSGPAKGTRGQVNVPAAVFNADTVKEAINAIVTHNDAVAGL